MILSIIMPVFNEEKTVEEIIQRVKNVKLPNSLQKDLIIVDDGSSDGTRELLEKYRDDPEIELFFHEKNIGKTGALATGIKEARGDIIMIQDADLEYHPNEYPKLLKPLLDGQADVVYGSRFMGDIKEMRLINRCANVISNIFFICFYFQKLTDINTCFKVFRLKVLEGIEIESKHFEFETEITAKVLNRGYKIHEIPVNYVARSKEDGKKISWGKAISMFWGMVKYRFSK